MEDFIDCVICGDPTRHRDGYEHFGLCRSEACRAAFAKKPAEEKLMARFASYQAMVDSTAKNYDETDPQATDGTAIPAYASLGLAGETGEVVELVKKAWRKRTPLDRAKVALELGDVLWYVARLSQRLGFTLEAVAEINARKLTKRNESDAKHPDWEHEMAASILAAATCTGLIEGTWILCGEGGHYCSDACWAAASRKYVRP